MTKKEESVSVQDLEEAAAPYGVSADVHTEDHIYNFLMSHPVFSSDRDRLKYYFGDGARSADQFDEIVTKHYTAPPERKSVDVLEFASGYGCVTRHLMLNQKYDVTACDIHSEAISFLSEKLGVSSLQSAAQPELLCPPTQYDVVFALSFFSHMPITTWSRWLVQLARLVHVGGLLVFTTHGQHSAKHLNDPEVGELGFYFTQHSEQSDLPLEQYGNTIALPSFVRPLISTVPQLEEVEVREGFWWTHQDLYILRKIKEFDQLYSGESSV